MVAVGANNNNYYYQSVSPVGEVALIYLYFTTEPIGLTFNSLRRGKSTGI